MHRIRWYDCVSCAFRSFSEDEKESRINGWRRNRRSAQSLLPAVRAVDGGFSAVGCGASCERFQSGWRLSSRKRRCPKEFSGALWPFRKEIEVITSSKTGSARQACFESPQSMKRDFQAFKNRTAVTKEERLRQRKNCAAIGKDKAAWLRGAIDNFLITVRLFGSFVPLVTVLFVVERG